MCSNAPRTGLKNSLTKIYQGQMMKKWTGKNENKYFLHLCRSVTTYEILHNTKNLSSYSNIVAQMTESRLKSSVLEN